MDDTQALQPHDDRDRLDGLTPQQLVAEIRQLCAQYSAEVSTGRRTWPRSIRERAAALRRIGVSRYRIAVLTGIPYNTVMHWFGGKAAGRAKPKMRGGKFLPVVRASDPLPVPPPIGGPTVEPPTVGGLTVVLPGGLEIRGLRTLTQVAELHRLLGARA